MRLGIIFFVLAVVGVWGTSMCAATAAVRPIDTVAQALRNANEQRINGLVDQGVSLDIARQITAWHRVDNAINQLPADASEWDKAIHGIYLYRHPQTNQLIGMNPNTGLYHVEKRNGQYIILGKKSPEDINKFFVLHEQKQTDSVKAAILIALAVAAPTLVGLGVWQAIRGLRVPPVRGLVPRKKRLYKRNAHILSGMGVASAALAIYLLATNWHRTTAPRSSW